MATTVCRLCITRDTLAMTPPTREAHFFATEEELGEHLEAVHHMPVQHESETAAEAEYRFLVHHPSALSCPECQAVGASWAPIMTEPFCQ